MTERGVSPITELQGLSLQVGTAEFTRRRTQERVHEFIRRSTATIEARAGGRETGAVNPLSIPSQKFVDAAKIAIDEATGNRLAEWLKPQASLHVVSNSQDSVRTCISLDFESEEEYPDGINMTIVDYFDGQGPKVTFYYSPFRYPRFQQPDERRLTLQGERKKIVESIGSQSELTKLHFVAQFLGRVVEPPSKPQHVVTS